MTSISVLAYAWRSGAEMLGGRSVGAIMREVMMVGARNLGDGKACAVVTEVMAGQCTSAAVVGGQVRKEAIACGASSSVSEAPVKDTCEERYGTLFELVTSEDIYFVNDYGRV